MPLTPINIQNWINENRHLLKPPVGNKVIYDKTSNFIIMVVGGPNARSDYHYNETEEFFYQIEGDIVVKIVEDGKPRSVPLKAGEIFLVPSKVPHCSQRPANTVGLVIEVNRQPGMKDGLLWHCEKCEKLVYEEYFTLTDIGTQLKTIMEKFYGSENLRTCKHCGHVQPIPGK